MASALRPGVKSQPFHGAIFRQPYPFSGYCDFPPEKNWLQRRRPATQVQGLQRAQGHVDRLPLKPLLFPFKAALAKTSPWAANFNFFNRFWIAGWLGLAPDCAISPAHHKRRPYKEDRKANTTCVNPEFRGNSFCTSPFFFGPKGFGPRIPVGTAKHWTTPAVAPVMPVGAQKIRPRPWATSAGERAAPSVKRGAPEVYLLKRKTSTNENPSQETSVIVSRNYRHDTPFFRQTKMPPGGPPISPADFAIRWGLPKQRCCFFASFLPLFCFRSFRFARPPETASSTGRTLLVVAPCGEGLR